METSYRYGEAINHYVHAGRGQKIIEVFQLLTSLSLVNSMSYPPVHQLDQDLNQLCTSPKQTVARLHCLNPSSGEPLMQSLSGYATLRRFYDLRDHELTEAATDDDKITSAQPSVAAAAQAMRPLARRRQAASALIALIESASDGIHGGLYDESVQSAVPTECLLPLLGEALAFVNRKSCSNNIILSFEHAFVYDLD